MWIDPRVEDDVVAGALIRDQGAVPWRLRPWRPLAAEEGYRVLRPLLRAELVDHLQMRVVRTARSGVNVGIPRLVNTRVE